MVMGAVFFESVAIVGADVIKCLLELFWWECSYWLGWSDQMVMGSVLVECNSLWV